MKRLSSERATRTKRRVRDDAEQEQEALSTMESLGLIDPEEEAQRLEEFEMEEALGNIYFRFSKGFKKVLRWRVLPPLKKGYKWFEKDMLHFNVGKVPIRCRRLINESCWVCDQMARMRQSRNRKTAMLADAMNPSTSYVSNGVLLIVDGQKVVKKVSRVIQYPKTVYHDIQGECFGTRDDFCNVADLREGYDLISRKVDKGQGNVTIYKTHAARQSTPVSRKDSIINRIISEMVDLKAEVVVPTRQEQQELFESGGDVGD